MVTSSYATTATASAGDGPRTTTLVCGTSPRRPSCPTSTEPLAATPPTIIASNCRDDEKLDKGTCGPLKVQLMQPYGHARGKPLTNVSWEQFTRKSKIEAVNFAVHGDESFKSRGTVDMPSELEHERYSSPTPSLRTSAERIITTRPTTTTATITSPTTTITTSVTPTVGATTPLHVAATTRSALSRRIQPSTVPPPSGATTEKAKIRTRDSHDSKPRPKRRRSKDRPSRFSRGGRPIAPEVAHNVTKARLTFAEIFNLLKAQFGDDDLVPRRPRRATAINSRIRVHAYPGVASPSGRGGIWERIVDRSHATVSELSYTLTVLLPFSF
ncbi:hypothetical protein FOZ60_000021 [Perkinsus olseni]|uniref:Uncharacterized protein n=1 Tax=Perkinsus olseni TaxID=32597 RepID=A0A7J6PNE0_PEROL|nr:hypothetical protein FOZ60_000021 [Perkinsus olseni]